MVVEGVGSGALNCQTIISRKLVPMCLNCPSLQESVSLCCRLQAESCHGMSKAPKMIFIFQGMTVIFKPYTFMSAPAPSTAGEDVRLDWYHSAVERRTCDNLC